MAYKIEILTEFDSYEEAMSLSEALRAGGDETEVHDVGESKNSGLKVRDRVTAPTLKGSGTITKLRKVGAWVLFDRTEMTPPEEWFVLYREMAKEESGEPC